MHHPISLCYTRDAAPVMFSLRKRKRPATPMTPVTPRRNPMFDSVRVRLTLWHAGAVACVLLILASATFFLLRRDSMRRIDNSLEDVADAFLATVRAELRDPNNSSDFKDSVAAAVQEHSYREISFSVFDAHGILILSSPAHPAFLESEASRFNQLRQQALLNPPV